MEEITDKGEAVLHQKNKFSVGETVELMKTDFRNIFVRVESIHNEDGAEMESAPHPKQKLYVKFSETPDKYDIIRRKEEA